MVNGLATRARFALRRTSRYQARSCEGERAMNGWIASATLLACVTAGSAVTTDVASAAKIITAPRNYASAGYYQQRARHLDRGSIRTSQPYDGGWTYYYGRPFFYSP